MFISKNLLLRFLSSFDNFFIYIFFLSNGKSYTRTCRLQIPTKTLMPCYRSFNVTSFFVHFLLSMVFKSTNQYLCCVSCRRLRCILSLTIIKISDNHGVCLLHQCLCVPLCASQFCLCLKIFCFHVTWKGRANVWEMF